MAREIPTCAFCRRNNWNASDELCEACRNTLGPNVQVSDLPGVEGVLDLALRRLSRQMIEQVGGWRDAMGEPLNGDIRTPAMPLIRAPALEVTIQVRFHDPAGKYSTKPRETKS